MIRLDYSSVPFLLILSVAIIGTNCGADNVIPSQNTELTCPGYSSCADEECQFSTTYDQGKNFQFSPDLEFILPCGSYKMDVAYPDLSSSSSYYTTTSSPYHYTQSPYYYSTPSPNYYYTPSGKFYCFHYHNSLGQGFNVMELRLSKPYEVSSASISCTVDNSSCAVVSDSSYEVRFVYGLPKECSEIGISGERVSYTPSRNLELTCQSRCPGKGPCTYVARRNYGEETGSSQFSGGMEAVDKCGLLTASVKCPGKGNQYCNAYKQCYTYELQDSNQDSVQGNSSFDVMELSVQGTGGDYGPPALSGLQCSSGNKPCPVFEATSYSVTFTIGTPTDCQVWNSTILDSGLLLPSAYQSLTCQSNDSCDGDSCNYSRELVSMDHDTYSANKEMHVTCDDLEVNITCVSYYSSSCSNIRQCYNYKSVDTSFGVMELTVQDFRNDYYSSNYETRVTCWFRDEPCQLFHQNTSAVTFVIGLPETCQPNN